MKRLIPGMLLAILLLVSPARAQDAFTAALPGLAGGFGQIAEAVEKLGASADARALPLLQALQEGRLLKREDGTLLLQTDAGTSEVPTGRPAEAGDAEAVRVNNRVRGALRGALGSLQILSTNPDERLKAAEDVFRSRSAQNIAPLETALSRETIPAIRAQIELSLAASRLASPDNAVRLQGINALAEVTDQNARALLLETKAQAPDLARQIDGAVAKIEGRLKVRQMVETFFQGLSLGSVLLLAALGLAVTFGVMGVINMAHGEMVMLGAYATYMVQEALSGTALAPFALPLAIPAAFLLAAAVGAVLERGLIRYLYGRPLETLLMTFGVGMILQQAVRLIFGAQNREVVSPAWMQGTLTLGGLSLTANRVWIIVFGLLVLGLVVAAIRYTRFGLEMRAVVQNRRIAATMGIRTGRVDALTFAFGSGIAGMAGVALSQIDNVSPNLGTGYIIDSFMVVVFGGVGSLAGTLVGALTLGVLNKVMEPYAGAVLAKVVVLVGIMLFIQRRPRGMFALKGRAAEA